MKTETLERVWKKSGQKHQLKVRFHDWNHQIKYFTILGENKDKILGQLSTGEKIAFSKRSLGWSLYFPDDEFQARAV